ncbi:killer cell lectin-like receptor subfamily B member 1 [Cricetulus griseus]|uniref:Killer cell lectin-like receptor subfamily B member 1 n=1 Tax=Cricetulus griseus TaxID=10029 RepID=A0A8C2LQ31_CRIGR|nr:killer cell lectin-like receptor subfamily B member 1 [Cricetulus griseus]XP_027285765.1 killer cell lectin-like receptor subfamily B member 1 [Cricetulus griseus]
MDTSVVYADLNLAKTQGLRHVSPPSLHSGTCRCPHWHRLALKLSCAGLILLVLSLTGLSVSVGFLVQKPPIEKCSAAAQENRTEPKGRSAMLTCPGDWHSYRDKCLFISQTYGNWSEGLADCSMKEATLLFIEDEEELKFIQDFLKSKEHQFFIGINYVPAEKTWKWINGSILNPDLLQVTGKAKEDSCGVISKTEVFSETCSADNRWVCQKKLKHV